MSQEPDDPVMPPVAGEEAEPTRRGRRPSRRAALLFMFAVFGLAIAYAWFTREQIADDVISGQLEDLGIPGAYEIESIGPSQQVLTNLVVGDPARPDLTIERVVIETEARAGIPGIGRITLVRPRVYGTYRDGQLSFGKLDPLIFTESDEPFSLPDFKLAIVEGGGVLESDFGLVGVKASGEGHLHDGFSGELAAIAPELGLPGCDARKVTFYGTIEIDAKQPRIRGPLRLSGLDCPESGLRLAKANMDIDLTADQTMDGADGRVELKTGVLGVGAARLAGTDSTVRLTYRDDALTARYEISGRGLTAPQARIGSLAVDGHLRAFDRLARLEAEGDVTGKGLSLGGDLASSLVAVEASAKGTMIGDVVAKVRNALRREARGSSLAGSFILRRTGEVVSLVMPRGVVRGGSGQSLLALSRLQARSGGTAPTRITGNFATGGRDLPRIAGRMEQASRGALAMRIAMPEYRAGSATLALPQLLLVQSSKGGLGFAGKALVSGALPGGAAESLEIPLDGNWSQSAGLALWRRCMDLRFARLQLADIAFERRSLPICPTRGGAIVRSTPDGLKVAGGVPSLDLAGRLGGTPISIASGPVGFAWPGRLQARSLDIGLGEAKAVSRFRVARLDARLGDDVAGTFGGTDVFLDAVPLDMFDANGNWRYADGRLALSDAAFRLEDREQDKRFQPLVSRDASLDLVDNRIAAQALLREPQSDREVVRAEIEHDLASGVGGANLFADAVVFDGRMQPDTLSRLALGVIANAEGVIEGKGRIDWNEQAVTSDGTFSTRGFDFAAAFGPVRGVAGTVHFADLLGLVTAPDQKLAIAAINPGIEVLDGELTFSINPDYIVEIDGARWPFFDGTLTLQPVTMQIGSDDPLRYTLEIDGLNAARFVEHMDLGNLAATGTFDGTLPLVFDEDGGHLVGGSLRARPPGGNVSYVGELTYEDLSTMANFAFDSLRSLDYREMTIGLDGDIDGEMVTRVRFSGIGQGEGASSNFLTRRIAKLPIRFNVNLRAPFFQLVTSVKSFFDPTYVRDPRTLGLLGPSGQPNSGESGGNPAPTPPVPPIQPPESDDLS